MEDKSLAKEKQNTPDEKPISEKNDDFVVIREQIKARPINKSKLFKNSLIVVVLAVIFGIVACVTFFFLSPFVSGILDKDMEVQKEDPFIFPEEAIEEEMRPEDMLIEEPEPEIDYSQFSYLNEDEVRSLVEGVVNKISFSVSDYQNLYLELSAIAYDSKRSLVRVTSVKSATDWMDTLAAGSSEMSGVLVAENDTSLFILTYMSAVPYKENIVVTFANNFSMRAEYVQGDSNTGLCILEVKKEDIPTATINYVTIAILGSSKSNYLAGTPIIALGSPMGVYGSFGYGIVTSNGKTINMADNNYSYITTDINGSNQATGVVINLKGNVVGIINTVNAPKDMSNVVGILGVTELKKTIERMVNQANNPFFGIKSIDVPVEAQYDYGAESGAFVLEIIMGSPAMNVGIQSGDIITSFNGRTINSYEDLNTQIYLTQPGDEVEVKALRLVQGEYKEIIFTVVMGQQK